MGVSLYLDPALLERLQQSNPLVRLNESNVADYWTALEGVSHFLYFAWNAGHDKPVTLLELELQAEIDKYVASYLLLKRQFPERFPSELLHVLFERTRIDSRLARRARESLSGGHPARGEVLPAPGALAEDQSRSGDGRRTCWRSCGVSIG